MTGAGSLAPQAFWLASRAAGVVAVLLLSASVLLGLAMAARLPARPSLRRAMAGAHQQIALTALAAIGVHGLLLLGDPWLHPGAAGVAVPFALPYRRPFTGAGILGGYVAALTGLSFYARRRIGARRWRSLHRLTVVAYGLAVVHVLGAGSDAGTPWLMGVVGVPAAAALALLAARIPRRRAVRRALAQGARP